MYNYSGINSDAFWLLGQNKFNNSKEFYDANKAEIKRLALLPMQQIAEIISNDMMNIDNMMNLIPSKMVSRIRRDTRFSKDKSLYRENIWIMFMRPKADWPSYPCMWFEVTPHSYTYGVSVFEATPRYMELYRQTLLERTDEFLTAVKDAEKTGAKLYADYYKKEKNSCLPDSLKMYYNVKSIYFMVYSDDLKPLENEKIITELKTGYAGFTSMYNFFKSISDEYISLG